MKLYYSAGSPYVRKVSVLAIETGLDARIERIPVALSPVKVTAELAAHNPLMKIPTLVTDDGLDLYDSPVICEYLDTLHSGTPLVPRAGPLRWRALRLQALADGILDAAVLCRFETVVRDEGQRSAEWVAGQTAKAMQGLDVAEREPLDGPLDIGKITLACAIGWLEFRKPVGEIRAGRPQLFAWYDAFARRPSMLATAPKA